MIGIAKSAEVSVRGLLVGALGLTVRFGLRGVLVQIMRNKISSKKPLAMEMSTTYWHFLDGLWLYLYVFLLLNH